jgi:hypothetical protein
MDYDFIYNNSSEKNALTSFNVRKELNQNE